MLKGTLKFLDMLKMKLLKYVKEKVSLNYRIKSKTMLYFFQVPNVVHTGPSEHRLPKVLEGNRR